MGGYGTYLTRMSPIPVSAAWVRGDVESNERDVEDAVPYGVVRNVASSNTQHASEAKRAANEAPTLGNVGLTDCNNQRHPVGQRPVLTRQRPRSETAVGDGVTK